VGSNIGGIGRNMVIGGTMSAGSVVIMGVVIMGIVVPAGRSASSSMIVTMVVAATRRERVESSNLKFSVATGFRVGDRMRQRIGVLGAGNDFIVYVGHF
jgi:hypothetical protein